MDETERKEEMNKRNEPDSFTLSSGSAAKGTAKALKVYFNLDNSEHAQKKIENLLSTVAFLKEKYGIEMI